MRERGTNEPSTKRIGYPVCCLSAYCGRILCDGCTQRPILLAYHKATGTEAEYLAGQERSRAIVARESER